MRLAFTFALALAISAWAGDGKQESVKGEHGATVGGAATSGGPTSGTAVTGETTEVSSNRDRLLETAQQKRWEAMIGYELHRMWIQTDLGGDAPNRLFNYWYAGFRYSVTPVDKLRLRFGVYERFIADSQETGLRTDDLVLSYTHLFDNLSFDVKVAVTASLTAPVSFYSQKMGLITSPELSIDASRTFGPVTFALRPYGVWYIQRYDSSEGGNPNPIGRIGASADVFVELPFFKPIVIGLDGYTGYSWYYSPKGTVTGQNQGIVQDATYKAQPVQQSYGGEVYVRYLVPELFGVKADVTLALADGDPTLGYSSRLHDGVSYFYVFYRHTAELYGNLTVRY